MKCPICKDEANEKVVWGINEHLSIEEIEIIEKALNRKLGKRPYVKCNSCKRVFDIISFNTHFEEMGE